MITGEGVAARAHSPTATAVYRRQWLTFYLGMAYLRRYSNLDPVVPMCRSLGLWTEFRQGIVWSLVWPVSWIMYLAGFL